MNATLMWSTCGSSASKPTLWCLICGEGSCFYHHMMQWIRCCYPAHPAGDEPGISKLVPSWPGPWSAVMHIMVSGRLPVQQKRVKSEKEEKKRVTGWGTANRRSAVWSRRALKSRFAFNPWFSSTLLLQYNPTLSKTIPVFVPNLGYSTTS